MNTPINVIFYEPYPMGLGGNFLTQRLIIEKLSREKFNPIIVAPMEGVVFDHFREMGVECVVMPPLGSLGKYGGKALREGVLGRIKSAVNLIRYSFQLRSFILKRNIGLIYSNSVRAQICIGIASVISRTPSVLYIKGVLANPIIDRLCYFTATKILFFCSQNRDDQYPLLTKWYRNKIEILEIGLDPASIYEIPKQNISRLSSELNINSSYINIAVLAQLYRPKGQHLAIEVVSRVVSDFPNVRLYLVGDHVIEEYKPYKLELESLVRKYKLDEHVFFTGWRKDALDIAFLMDIIIHPSLAEGFGRAVLESMALGKPVIASAVGGLREAITDGKNGYLIQLGNVDMMELKLRELLTSPSLRKQIGQEAKNTVFSDYLIDDKVIRLANIWTKTAKYPSN
jgi:glycosyltransferase involved in cell wall biosynthesis